MKMGIYLTRNLRKNKMRGSCLSNCPSNQNESDFAMAHIDVSQLSTSRQFAIEHNQMYYIGSICKRGHDGVRYSKTNHCVKCTLFRISTKEMIEYKKQYRRSKHGKDVANLYNKLYYQNNRENEITRSKKYQKEHPEKAKAQRQKHNKRIKAAILEWRKNNPHKCREHERNRRARILNAPGDHTHDQVSELLIAQDYKCVNCKCCLKTNKKHLDHIIPLSLGGGNDIKNLQWLCAKCNMSKHTKDPIEWAQQNGRLL